VIPAVSAPLAWAIGISAILLGQLGFIAVPAVAFIMGAALLLSARWARLRLVLNAEGACLRNLVRNYTWPWSEVSEFQLLGAPWNYTRVHIRLTNGKTRKVDGLQAVGGAPPHTFCFFEGLTEDLNDIVKTYRPEQ
jgi:hypothetical protein